MKTTLVLNWFANPYHTPLYVAKALGFFDDCGLDLAILQPANPSDVTQIVGTQKADFGLKAMIHCYAARERGYPIKSFGTLLDEPPTGLLFLQESGIKEFKDLKGKRIGFVGEFGKIIFDDLAKRAGIAPSDYEMVRVGMHAVDAIARGRVDAAMGIACFQQVELESRCGPTDLLRVDELAGLGCCCFCSVLLIAHENFIASDPDRVHALMQGLQRGMAYTQESPDEAFEIMCDHNPHLRDDAFKKVFVSCLPYFSRRLENVERDWNKVGKYAQHLGVSKEADPSACYTNAFVPEPHVRHAALPS